MKKILIFYASFGGGHLSAAKSIEGYLKENYDDLDIELIDCMKYASKTFEKISTTAYKEMAKKAPWVWGRMYKDSGKKTLAHITSRANSVLAIKLLRLLRQKQPDIIISTQHFGSQMCTYLKRKGKINCKIATILTDFKSHYQWLVGNEQTDLYFVSNDDMKQELIEKNIPEYKIHVTGIPVKNNFLQKYDKAEILQSLEFTENKKTILLFGGGEFGLGKSMTLKVLTSLAKNFNNTQIIAISGKNESMNKSFKEIVAEYNRENDIKIFEFTDKVAEYMSIADLVVTKPGGLTSTESLVSNLPMLIINPIPGQEEENAEFLENKNIGIWIRKHDNVDEIISNLLTNDELLNTMRENAKKIAKPNSTESICKIILK